MIMPSMLPTTIDNDHSSKIDTILEDDDCDSSISSGASASSLDDLFFTEQILNASRADEDENDSDDSSSSSSSSSMSDIIISIGDNDKKTEQRRHRLDSISSTEYYCEGEMTPAMRIASLQKQLQELRESTDDEYALAIEMAAKDRKRFERQLDKAQRERDDALTCNQMQQRHIDSLTEQVITLQETTRQAEEASEQHERDFKEASSQLEHLCGSLATFQRTFEEWMKNVAPQIVDQEEEEEEETDRREEASIATATTAESSALDATGLEAPSVENVFTPTGMSPSDPMVELEQAYSKFSSVIEETRGTAETSSQKTQRDNFPKRSWPEPPHPIKLPFLSVDNSKTSRTTTTKRAPTRTRRDSTPHPRQTAKSTASTHPRKNKSIDSAGSDVLVQADFIKEAVNKRRSTWSNLSLLLRDPAEDPQEGNLMGQVVEFRVDPV